MKKVFMIIISIVLILGLSSCNEYEDLMPSYEDYAVWDGNYIYKGNYRSKTTGEGEQQLIKDIVYEDITYNIDSYNYAIYNKNIYFIFTAFNGTDENIEYSTFLIKYDIYEKSYKVLYAFLNEKLNLSIYELFEDFIYLKKYDSSSLNDYYVYDVHNKKMNILEDISYLKIINEDVFIVKERILYHFNFSEHDFSKVMSYKGKELSIEKVSGSDKFRIIFKDGQYHSLGFYDKITFKYSELINIEDKKEIKFISDEYFLTYETKEYEYYYNQFDTSTKKLLVNNILYKVDLEKSSYELVYKFEDENADFTKGIIIDNIYYMNKIKVRKGFPFFPGGSKTKGYKLNLDTLKLSRNFKKISLGNELVDQSVTYGDLHYYFDTDIFGPIMGRRKVYYLYCKDISNDQVYLMQFFVYYDDQVHLDYQGTRSAYDMWMESIDFTNKYVIVLDY